MQWLQAGPPPPAVLGKGHGGPGEVGAGMARRLLPGELPPAGPPDVPCHSPARPAVLRLLGHFLRY